jgi:hypothetical protein
MPLNFMHTLENVHIFKLILNMSIPLVLTLIYYIMIRIAIKLKKKFEWLKSSEGLFLSITIQFLYPMIVNSSFGMINCTNYDTVIF